MTTIRVGGVPEHFNLPWHLCIEQGDFNYEDLLVEWTDFTGGTGAMNEALKNNEIDVAIILTEGIVKDITLGNPSRIIQTYVDSPLLWGIHVAQNSGFKHLNELENSTAAISRKGSGSELMAYIQAKDLGWDTEDLKFETVGDIDGGVAALKSDKAQFFMWEHFTTKPLVDNKTFRRLGDFPTPWPCFVIAAREDFIRNNEQGLSKMLGVVNAKTVEFKGIPEIVELLSSRYGQRAEDVKEWLEITSWSQDQMTDEELNKVLDALLDLKLIPQKLPVSNFIYNLETSNS